MNNQIFPNVFNGVQMQGAAKWKYHKNKTFDETVMSVLASIVDTGAMSIRIPGGKNARGAWYKGDGNGDAKFAGQKCIDNPDNHPGEYNHFQVYVAAAKAANIGVWLTLHAYMDDDDVSEIYTKLEATGVRIDGVSVANEPYAPEYLSCDLWDWEFDSYQICVDALRRNGYEGYIGIPAMLGMRAMSREKRAQKWAQKVRESGLLLQPKICLDIHPYYPADAFSMDISPFAYLNIFMDELADNYADVPVVVTEWALKNQYEYDIDKITKVISEYMEVFRSNKDKFIACYYNTMPGDAPGAPSARGLFDFTKNQLTEQGRFFAKV